MKFVPIKLSNLTSNHYKIQTFY